MKVTVNFINCAVPVLMASMRMRIRIQIQEAKPMRIQADPDRGQTFKSQKVEFVHKKYT
jgi:hypothetical protein